MAERWLTYQQLGDVLGMTASAARQRALRFKWRKMPGNDGKMLVLLPDGVSVQPRNRTSNKHPVQTPEQTPSNDNDNGANALAAAVAAFQRVEEDLRAERDAARVGQVTAQAEVVAERARAEEALVRAASAEGELRGLRDAMAREARQREQLEATLKAAEAQRDAAQAVQDAQQSRQHDLFGGYIGRVVQAITGRKPRG